MRRETEPEGSWGTTRAAACRGFVSELDWCCFWFMFWEGSKEGGGGSSGAEGLYIFLSFWGDVWHSLVKKSQWMERNWGKRAD